nr:hypothetical protein Iba_chr03cCG10800 [Ipomoea batatas]
MVMNVGVWTSFLSARVPDNGLCPRDSPLAIDMSTAITGVVGKTESFGDASGSGWVIYRREEELLRWARAQGAFDQLQLSKLLGSIPPSVGRLRENILNWTKLVDALDHCILVCGIAALIIIRWAVMVTLAEAIYENTHAHTPDPASFRPTGCGIAIEKTLET